MIPETRLRRRQGAFYLSVSLKFGGAMAIAYVLQLMLKDLGAPIVIITMAASIHGLMQAICSPAWGRKSDASKRPALLYVTVIAVPFLVFQLLGVTSSIALFLLFLAAAACFDGGFIPVGLDISMLYGEHHREKVSRHISIFTASLAFGSILGRLSLAAALSWVSASGVLRIGGLFGLFSVLAALAAGIRRKPVPASELPTEVNMETPYAGETRIPVKIISQAGLWPVYIGTLMLNIPIIGFISLSGVFQMDHHQLSFSSAAFLAAFDPLGMFLASLLLARLLHSRNPKTFLAAAFLCTALSLAVLYLSSSLAALACSWALLGASTALFQSAGSLCIAEGFPKHRRAEGIGLQWTAATIGMVAGPLAAGAAASVSYSLMFLVFFLVSLAGMAYMIIYRAFDLPK